MNLEMIADGIVVLVCVALLQWLRFASAFQALILAFTFGWSALAAMHGWGLSTRAIAQMGIPGLNNGQVSLAAYWLVFIVTTLPAKLLTRFWLGTCATRFPFLLDRVLHLVCSFALTLGAACVLLMSVALGLPESVESVEEPENAVQWVCVTARRIPLQAYLCVAGALSSDRAAEERLARVPEPARVLFRVGDGGDVQSVRKEVKP